MIDLVLDDLGCPAGKIFDALFAIISLVLQLDVLPAFGFADAFQRKTALLGFIGAGLFEDNRIVQHQIALFCLYSNDALGNTNHICGHAHTAIGMGGQRFQQVAGGVRIRCRGRGRLLGKKKWVVTNRFYYKRNTSLRQTGKNTVKTGIPAQNLFPVLQYLREQNSKKYCCRKLQKADTEEVYEVGCRPVVVNK